LLNNDEPYFKIIINALNTTELVTEILYLNYVTKPFMMSNVHLCNNNYAK